MNRNLSGESLKIILNCRHPVCCKVYLKKMFLDRLKALMGDMVRWTWLKWSELSVAGLGAAGSANLARLSSEERGRLSPAQQSQIWALSSETLVILTMQSALSIVVFTFVVSPNNQATHRNKRQSLVFRDLPFLAIFNSNIVQKIFSICQYFFLRRHGK